MTVTTGSLLINQKTPSSIKAEGEEEQDTVAQALNMREFLKKNDDFNLINSVITIYFVEKLCVKVF